MTRELDEYNIMKLKLNSKYSIRRLLDFALLVESARIEPASPHYNCDNKTAVRFVRCK